MNKTPITNRTDGPRGSELPDPGFVPGEILVATNSENVKTFMATGLIHPVEGFRKYYRDLSRQCPEHLPLFTGALPDSWIADCREEDDIDVVILSLDLPWDAVRDAAGFHVTEAGELVSGSPARDVRVSQVYCRGVIPVSRIRTMYLESAAAKQRFLDYRYSNFDPGQFSLTVQPRRFAGKRTRDPNLFGAENPPVRFPDIDPRLDYPSFLQTSARGGLVAVLMHALPKVPESQAFVTYVTQPPPVDYLRLDLLPGQMKCVRNWLWNEPVQTGDADGFLLWHLMTLLSGYDPLKGLTSSVFLEDLQIQLDAMGDLRRNPSVPYDDLKEQFRRQFDQVQAAVDQTRDPLDFFHDATVRSPVVRGLLLFLLRQNRTWNFHEEDGLVRDWAISGKDYLVAILLYGVWQGWNFLEDTLRPRDKKRMAAVMDFMADWHNRHHSGLPGIFSENRALSVSANCRLWEKEILATLGWPQINHPLGRFAVYLAKKRNWPALQTRIVIPRENLSSLSYEKNGNVSVSMAGTVAMKETVDKTLFFESLESTELDEQELEQFQALYGR